MEHTASALLSWTDATAVPHCGYRLWLHVGTPGLDNINNVSEHTRRCLTAVPALVWCGVCLAAFVWHHADLC